MSAGAALRGPAAPASLRPLLALGAAVLVLHLLVLQAVPGAPQPPDPLAGRVFVTRTLKIDGAAAEQAASPSPAARAPQADTAPPASTAPPAPSHAPAPAQARPEARIEHARPAASTPPAAAASAPEPSQMLASSQPLAPAAASSPAPDVAPPVPASATPPATSTTAPAAQGPAPATGPGAAGAPERTALSVPGSVRLNYEVTGEKNKLTYHALGSLLWRHDGSQYEARMELGAFLMGTRVDASTGRITPDGLAPVRYSQRSRGEQATHFDRALGRIVFSNNKPQVPLPAQAQDRVSVFLQLASMIGGEPARYPPGSRITLPTAGTSDIDTWTFTVVGQEPLSLGIGQTQALHLVRERRGDYDLQVEAWLAPALGYLPVRLRLTQSNGDYADQLLRSTDKP